MNDPRMQMSPLPPAPPGLDAMPPEAAAPAMPKAAEMVVMALQAMQAERQGENDAVLAAVMAATQGMPSGIGGVAEGGGLEVPGTAGPELGAY